MNGDIAVKFVISGPGGNSIVLTRLEAEHLQKQLKLALKATGKVRDVANAGRLAAIKVQAEV